MLENILLELIELNNNIIHSAILEVYLSRKQDLLNEYKGFQLSEYSGDDFSEKEIERYNKLRNIIENNIEKPNQNQDD